MDPDNQGLLHDKNDKTRLIHRPIDICATSPPKPDKANIKRHRSHSGARIANKVLYFGTHLEPKKQKAQRDIR
jgi:hypothetical protein